MQQSIAQQGINNKVFIVIVGISNPIFPTTNGSRIIWLKISEWVISDILVWWRRINNGIYSLNLIYWTYNLVLNTPIFYIFFTFSF